jgi:CheY-like chemotaxis protein/anti-sigma regulatory factor (Ser/Thr protein kinase)
MRFDMQEHSLGTIIQTAVQGIEAYAQKFNVRIDVEPLTTQINVSVDEERLIQVLSNLLSNAVKFSPPGSTVRLLTSRERGRARVSVIDYGAGIPEEFHGRIFEKFSQADSSASRRAGGTGLGLHITRQIMEHMDGSIGFDSEVGQGTTFWVELPSLSERPVSFEESVTLPNIQLEHPRVLHVEEDVDLSSVIAAGLQGRAEVVHATDLAKARHLLRRHRFSLMVMDVALPDGSGLDLLDRIDTLAGYHIPVIILCAEAPATEVRERVAAVMVKTRISEARIVESIVDMLDEGRMVVNG